MRNLFGILTTSGDCFGLMMGGCKGIITTSGDCKGIMTAGIFGVIYPS